jgi:hypothetical protein
MVDGERNGEGDSHAMREIPQFPAGLPLTSQYRQGIRLMAVKI